jgi:N-acetylmuramoyl-L-alanine amidase
MSNIKYRIYLDAGHFIGTQGKQTPFIKELNRHIKEAEFNYPVVAKIASLAKKCGIEVVIVSPNINVDMSLDQRVDKINNDYRKFISENKDNKAVVVSVHFNAHKTEFHESNAEGVETFYFTGSVEGKKLAESVHKEVIKGVKQVNRGVKHSNFTIIAKTLPPAILCELGFMDSINEHKLMLNDGFQSETSHEILTGVLNYFGIQCNIKPIVLECDCEKLKKQVVDLNATIKSLQSQLTSLQSESKKLKEDLSIANNKITQGIYALTK